MKSTKGMPRDFYISPRFYSLQTVSKRTTIARLIRYLLLPAALIVFVVGCDCGPREALCGTPGCIDLTTSDSHCGECGNSCGPNETCQNGECTCAGASCSGVCRDTTTDPNNCGGCNLRCPRGSRCSFGACSGATGPVPPVVVPTTRCGGATCAADEFCLRCDRTPTCQKAGSTCCQPYSGPGGDPVIICEPDRTCITCGISRSCHERGASCCIPQSAGQSVLICESNEECVNGRRCVPD